RMALFALLAMVATTATGIAQSPSPYAGQEQRTIKALSDEEIRDLLEARGMGLAKAAELNSYPGPLHVLQLANELGLSDAQRKATDTLYANMRQRALSIGRQIIEAERALDRAFANGAIEPATLRSQVTAIATLQGKLRAVHLEAHLAQRSLLTPERSPSTTRFADIEATRRMTPVVMGARATQLRLSSFLCTVAKMNEATVEHDANDRHARSDDVGNGPHLAPRHHLPASGNRRIY